MSKKRIDNPKVFISYAWGSDDYQNKVLAFASQLMSDGVDVVLDKWDLSEGNDTYAFMEKCVSDETITNVLMLIDPIYAEKADAHSGGVGTETQIISPKVYQEVTQDKFIPIVFERNDKSEVCKPTYLQGRLHFDLSLDDKYDEEYLRLVKTLYGEQVYPKPEKGNKPAWVEKASIVEVKKRNSFDTLKTVQPDKARRGLYSQFISETLAEIKKNVESCEGINDEEQVLLFYKKFGSIRSDYVVLLDYSIYVNEAEEYLAKELEQCENDVKSINSAAGGLARNFIHELFLYTVAYFLKSEDYEAAGKILARPYYDVNNYRNKVVGYDIFYSGRDSSLDRAMNKRDEKNYICGTATCWIEHVDGEKFSKEQFIFADLICFNYAVYGKDTLVDWHWFPMTYIYDNEYRSTLGSFAKRFISRNFIKKVLPLFGYESIEEFKSKMESVAQNIAERKFREIRYNEAWRSAPLLNEMIETEEIAKTR